MAERLVGRDDVADALLQFGDLGKAAFVLARPDYAIAAPDDEHAAGAGYQGDAAEFILEGGEQLLRHPGGAQKPAALPAVFDFETGQGTGLAH